ncbi:unnamed protein product [Nesidiocoris tenuis]|uniref:Cytochrome c oxidase assembly factor 3 n=1 Tax=Nesidiocoris tenuis TaxID=355587 RepID=A0A6H5HI74_9HEMI|nr:unnamed protein product [Nesidiocoris tenuis]
MADERMPKVDFSKEASLNKNILDFIKLAEQDNLRRVQKLQRIRRNNLVTAFALGGTVLAIYGYSFYAVKQESFLDDFDEPKIKDVQ